MVWHNGVRGQEERAEEAYLKLRKVKAVSFEEDLRLVDEAAEVRAELQSSISNAISFISSPPQDPSMEKTPEKSPIAEPAMIKEGPEKDLDAQIEEVGS